MKGYYMTIKKAIAYIRVSTDKQSQDGTSLNRQREQVEKYASFLDTEVTILQDDGVSGFKDNRPGYLKLIEKCQSGEVDTVIIPDLSRLSRKTSTILWFIEKIADKKGINLISLKENIDTSTPMGKAFITFSAMFNQLYRDEIAYKTKNAMAHKRDKGEYCGGIIPYGFKKSGKMLKPCEKERNIISKIKDWSHKGYTVSRIRKLLLENQIKNRSNKTSWAYSSIKSILENNTIRAN